MLHLILFGPPGSGKGTQAKTLAERHKLIHISTGDLFRYEIGNKTELGRDAQRYMNQGQLVPDTVTVGMLRAKVERHPDAAGFIFDGFPRTVAQAHALDRLLADKGDQVFKLIELVVPEDETTARLLDRGKTSGRADDANEDVIRARYAEYKQKTAPVYDHYEELGRAERIDGLGSPSEVGSRLEEAVQQRA